MLDITFRIPDDDEATQLACPDDDMPAVERQRLDAELDALYETGALTDTE
jgi:hypothetical protein